MNGGKLVQHCSGHALGTTHEICNRNGLEYHITSTHHQMQYPYNLVEGKDYEILYKSSYNRSNDYEGLGGYSKESLMYLGEPEIVLYHVEGKPKCLAIQGHPEIMPVDSAVCEMLRNLIDSLL